jgi:phage terminase large subunit-like protein
MDKHVRLNSVAPIFEAGHVWRPDMDWAEEVQEECAAFPYGEHDDLVDATTLALLRYRQGSFISLYDDEPEEPLGKRNYEYY